MTKTFPTRTHKDRVRFSIPKAVRDQLGLQKQVKLTIISSTGRFEGIKEMKSGPEIYGKDISDGGIRKNQKIEVEASLPEVLGVDYLFTWKPGPRWPYEELRKRVDSFAS